VRWPGTSTLSVLTALVALSACGAGSSPATQRAEQNFLGSVHAQAPDIGTYRSDVQLVRLAHAACDGFKGGASYEQLADRLVLDEGPKPLPTEDLGTVISSAVSTLCPQFESRVTSG
jgi:hypothetical protein